MQTEIRAHHRKMIEFMQKHCGVDNEPLERLVIEAMRTPYLVPAYGAYYRSPKATIRALREGKPFLMVESPLHPYNGMVVTHKEFGSPLAMIKFHRKKEPIVFINEGYYTS